MTIPIEETPLSILCIGPLCIAGMSILSRFRNTLSPMTDREAQFLVDLGALKNTGLKNIQRSDNKPGIKHHHPIQILLQNAKTISGKTEYLVHTLQGFECFIQFSCVKLKALATFLSNVIILLLHLIVCFFFPFISQQWNFIF